ncbi:MAG: hypothetical protein R3277_05480 [Brumimicrobium sp.]|nr:hypothetical protein [Brumimicrobium sp.]
MKPSTELFVLIKSLTKSEKRFFKLSSSIQTGDKNYLKIFDFIDDQEVYDEEALKNHFKDENFIKHLPSEKNHLYKLILKSLRSFYSEQSVSSILKEELKNIEILYNKALFKECRKFLKRAKRIAEENEKFYYLFELISWEKRLTEESYEAGDFDVDLNKIIEEESIVLDKLRNLAEYHVLYSRINAIFRSGGFTRNEQERETVREISDNYLIKGKNTAISTRAASICYYIKGLCAAANRDFSDSYVFFNRTKEILDNNEKLRQDLGKRYVLTLYHLMRCYMDERNFDMAHKMIENIGSLKGEKGFGSTDLTLKIMSISLVDQMNIYNLRGDFEKAFELYESNEAYTKNVLEQASKEQRVKLSYTLAYTYFGMQEYRQALNVINEILNDNEQNLRQDLYSFARILNLMVHFELENFDLIEYSSGATLRYLNKTERDYQIEIFFVKELKRLAKNPDKVRNPKSYRSMEESLRKLLDNPNERVILDYIDVLSWTKSKKDQLNFDGAIRIGESNSKTDLC